MGTLARTTLALVLLAAAPAVAAEDPYGRTALQIGRALADKIGPRPSGSPAARVALDSIAGRLMAAGFEVKRHSFSTVRHPGVRVLGRWFLPPLEATYASNAENLYVVVPGRSTDAVLLSAHVDSEAPDVPGARDDAAAVGLVVETAIRAAARARRDGPPPRTLVFAIFEGEERGHLGARAFARDGVAGNVVFHLSLDVLGARGLALNGLGPTVDRPVVAHLLRTARRLGVPLDAPIPHLLFSRLMPQGERSDHRAFAEKGVPALHLMARGDEGFDPCYHTARDTGDRLDEAALSATALLLDESFAGIGAALDGSRGDTRFLPLALLDPLGLSRGPTLVLPGVLARLLALAFVVGAMLLLGQGVWAGRKQARRALVDTGLSLAAGALLGIAFLIPFVLSLLAGQKGVPWHAPFNRYVLAGGLLVLGAGLALPAMLRRGTVALRLGAFTLFAISIALAAAGIAEVALFPALGAVAIAGAARLEGGPARIALVIPGLWSLAALLRPALYRDGALTGTFPESSALWILAVIVISALLLPAALELLAIGFGVFARLKRAFAILVLGGAAAVGAFALRAPAYTDAAPAVAQVLDHISAGFEGFDLRSPVGGTLSREPFGEVNMPVDIKIEEESAGAGTRTIAVKVERRKDIVPIDRAEITYFADCPARWHVTGGTVSTNRAEPFLAAWFSVPESFVERRTIEGADCPIAVSVRVQMSAPPVELLYSAPVPATARITAEVTEKAYLAPKK